MEEFHNQNENVRNYIKHIKFKLIILYINWLQLKIFQNKYN